MKITLLVDKTPQGGTWTKGSDRVEVETKDSPKTQAASMLRRIGSMAIEVADKVESGEIPLEVAMRRGLILDRRLRALLSGSNGTKATSNTDSLADHQPTEDDESKKVMWAV